jgi:hypothetical protein
MKILTFFLFLILCLSCNSRTGCEYPVSIQLYKAFPNQEFEIRVNDSDSIIFHKNFEKFFLIDAYKPNEYLVKKYCGNAKSIKVHFIVNRRSDTTFFVNPRLIKNIYLGCDQLDSISIFFDFRNGKSDLTFE